ncbi:MAG: hypothetical protein ACRDFQ_07825, partial [Anaerolineales bacterium]
MPGLAQSLEGHDLGHIRILAGIWGIELKARDAREGIDHLSHAMLSKETITKEVGKLETGAHRALSDLASARGRLPWAQFTRRHGELREMGPGRRDKEQPHLHPISATEILWYRGLVARAFFDSPEGPLEFAYIPDDLLRLLRPASRQPDAAYGRPARPEERRFVTLANDHILDEACTLLAGLRMGRDEDELMGAEEWRASIVVLKALLRAAKIFGASGQPLPDTTRKFLEADRGEALAWLAKAWRSTQEFNELHLLPGLKPEGYWENDPLRTRESILRFVKHVPAGQWWSIQSFIADVKKHDPDFQRPAGDYDSWYLRDGESGEYLRGFERWDRVDGAVISFIITGPMHWLGLLDLASNEGGGNPNAFRWTAWSDALLGGRTPGKLARKTEKLKVDSQGRISASRLVPPAARYQLARFCEWLPKKRDLYQYQVTAGSLEAAKKQGLEVLQLIKLLKAHSGAPLPPNLLQALKRWEQQGPQASLQKKLVLRVNSAAALK